MNNSGQFSQPSNTSVDSSSAVPGGEEDLSVFVQNLLQQMQSKFEQMSESIIQRIDEMGTRIDDLEKSIGHLVSQTNKKPEESKQQLKD